MCSKLPSRQRCVRISAYDVGQHTKNATSLGAAASAVSAATHSEKKKQPRLPASCAPFFDGTRFEPDFVPATSPDGVQPDMCVFWGGGGRRV